MKYLFSRLGLLAMIACAGCPAVGQSSNAAAPAATTQPTPELASIDQLKIDAFKAIRGGDFDRSSDLLDRAATLSHDPQVIKMAQWAKQFETQQDTFAGERHKQFDKALGDVLLLLVHHMDSYAIDETASACLLADDKEEFRHEKWVTDLINESATAADSYENSEQWGKALRMYFDLESLEPANPAWKDKLKLATRRMRLLMVYAPDRLKKLEDVQAKEREAADSLLRSSTTQPTTMAATTQPDADQAEGFKVDWHEVTAGIHYDMLGEALRNAQEQYYRQVSFQDLLEGGLMGLKAVVTTKGLEDAFPNLADQNKRKQFLDAIDSCMADANAGKYDTAEGLLDSALETLEKVNKQTVQLPEGVFVSEFADGAFSKLDPFSNMIWPYDVEEFQKTTQGEFGGVGIQIQLDESANLTVISPLPDTPAYRAGINPGDIITKIDGKNAHGITTDRAVKIITGAPGTPVTLTIRSADGSVRDVVVTREIIKVDSVKGYIRKPGGDWDYFIDPDQKIAYIRLTNFTRTSADDMAKTINEIKEQGARAIILDLRSDPGGLLQAAIAIVNDFVREGVIVSTHPDHETRNPPTVANAVPGDFRTDLPMVVLVNQYSASASEIVSGAIKDHHRALIVGERTFGKGSVQMLFPLDSRTTFLKLTTSHYYLPNGRCIHREENSSTWGVDPDVTVEMTPEQMGAAIRAQQNQDILRGPAAGPDTQPSKEIAGAATQPTTKPAPKDLLSLDPQLSAGLLVLRLELFGAQF